MNQRMRKKGDIQYSFEVKNFDIKIPQYCGLGNRKMRHQVGAILENV